MDNIEEKIEAAIDVTGGVVSNVQPFYLEKNQMYYFKNVSLDQLGARVRRAGCSSYGVGGVECGGLAPWVYKDSTRYLVGYWDNDIYTTTGDYEWTKGNDAGVSIVTNHILHGTFGQIYNDTTTATFTSTALFTHSVYPSSADPTLSALSILTENGQGTLQASMHPRSVEWWQGRLWAGGFAEPELGPDTIVWSTILNGWDFDLSNTVMIDANKGDEIMKILPTRSEKPRMYVFKRHSIHAFDVVWTGGAQIPTAENTIDAINSKTVILTNEIGTIAPNSVVYASGAGKSDVFFLSRDGVRSLDRVEQDTAGGVGPPLSEPIQDIIDRIHWAYADKATSAVYDHKLYMGIPVDGSTENNATIVYDLLKKRWVGEYTLEPRDMIVYNFNNEGEKLLGAWEHSTSEQVGDTLEYTAGAHLFHFLDPTSQKDPSDTSYVYEEQTKAYTFGNMGAKKRWNWVDIECTPTSTTITVTVSYKLDDQAYQPLASFDVEPSLVYPLLPSNLPWDFTNAERVQKRLSLMDIDIGQTIQLKLWTDSPASFGTRTTRISAWPLHEAWE